MGRGSGRLVFGLSLAVAGGVVWAVHRAQSEERARMFGGVLRDLERQERRREAREKG